MSRHLSRLQAVVLGLTVLAVFALGTLGLFAIGGRHGLGSDSFRVLAGFQDIGGVEVGTRVRIQGIDAGEVEEILAPQAPGESVKLRLRLSGKLRHLVRADARVQVAGEGLLPGKIVRIVPGRPDAEPVADGAELAATAAPELAEELAHASVKLNEVLAQVKSTLHDFRQGQVVHEMAKATTRLNQILVRADEALKGVDRGRGTLGKLLKDESLYNDLITALHQVNGALDDLRSGKGTLGRLVKSNDAYAETLQSLQEMRRMMTSVKQNADAIKSMPVVRSYVVDPNKELIRPNCTRLRKWLTERALFEPGRAVLTERGKRALDGVASWLNEHKEDGSEVVVAAFAAPDQNPDFAHRLTEQQSEAALQYLRSEHRIHRVGFWWWSNRKVQSLGCGTHRPPVPETERLPPARLEFIVFIPEN